MNRKGRDHNQRLAEQVGRVGADAERSRETDLVRISEAASRLGIGQERTWGRGYGCKEGRSLWIDRTCKRKRSLAGESDF